MFQLGAIVFSWLFWFLSAAFVIRWDAKRQGAIKEAAGEVDLMDRSVTPYLILSIFCGALPLVVYFGVTRRSAKGWLLGVGMFCVQVVVVVIFSTCLQLVAKPLDDVAAAKANRSRTTEVCSTPPSTDASFMGIDSCSLYLRDYIDGTEGRPKDPAFVTKTTGLACDSGHFWACERLLAQPGPDAERWRAKERTLCKGNGAVDPARCNALGP